VDHKATSKTFQTFIFSSKTYPLDFRYFFDQEMADPISLASGLLALAVFALQSSKTLYQTFESFQNSGRNVRGLKQELAALNDVLQTLQETVNQNDTKLSALKLPLLSCGKACAEFTVVVAKCTAHSNGSRSSFRDWARLTYMGKDIAGFTSLMAGYKSTITIALGDANM
jgi:Fungal N-terminal domain of STAND proteins